MTDQYYGYAPTRLTHGVFAGFTDDYLDNTATAYAPTQWDTVDIEQMWEYVRNESDERTVALAEAWRRTGVLLQATRESLKRHADGLAARWQSPAGHYFMTRVGAALHSLDEWREVADRHASGLEQVASKITQTQRDMRELWLTYQTEQERQNQKRKADEGLQLSDIFGLNNGKSFKEVQKEFHERAKNIVKPLAELYIDVSYTNIYRGGRYKGPTEMAEVNLEQLPQPARPNAPIGLQPPAPTMPGGRLELPNHLDVTPHPSPPELSDGVGLAGGTVTAPPPTLGPSPATPPVPTTPTPAPPPVLPGVSRPTNLRPTLPTTTSRPGTPRTTLPGANNPGAPNPTHRGPSANRATLPGNTGAPGPHSPRPGPSRTGSPKPTPPPPTLDGKHSTSPSSIGHPTPPAANRPTPSTGSGTRAGGTRPVPSTGPAPSLGGRRGTPTAPRTGARQAAAKKTQSWEYGGGDGELWATEPPPTGTVDTPIERRPRHHGRALGQG
ncbi:WXG100 family type VII secretion target [Salinispora mooreana]|uniref:WXG100 family type VII secretion target n=1 Tax=Salinispora mooreana TaxID=999545 RepID=UPI0003A5466A|nr:hypothetical protein [Salinispora mooreana]